VGSGLYGATFAYLAKQKGKKCLVIDKRSHIGGNVYCDDDEGIHVHKYGAHIFHTSNKQVWDFVNSFVQFNRYTNSPVANYKGELYNLPFNMNTFYQMWGVKTPVEAIAKIEEQKKDAVAILDGREPTNLEEQALTLIGKDIYERLIKGYTEKQWGRKCTELPAFIINRLPVRFVFDNNYFNDRYQGIPIGGYTGIVEKLLEGIEVRTNTEYRDFIKENPDIILTFVKNPQEIVKANPQIKDINAIKNSKSIDTSMGFTPLAGVMMGTRSGDIDPSIIPYIMKHENLAISEVMEILNEKSGLLGISDYSSDMRDIRERKHNDEKCQFAYDLYISKIVDYLVKYINKIGNNIDAIVFTAGVAENNYDVRESIISGINIVNLKLDQKLNTDDYYQDFKLISASDSDMPIYVVKANEEIYIANEVKELFK